MTDNPQEDHKEDHLDPNHYNLPEAPMKVETAIDVVFACGWGEAFCKGNALKYMTRAGKKLGDAELKDMKKARNYLQFYINHIETGHPRRLGEIQTGGFARVGRDDCC